MNSSNNKQLYFIPILDDASKQPDRRTAYLEALSSIDNMGVSPEFQEGYRHFRQFIEAARSPLFPDLLLECDGQLVARVTKYSTQEEIRIHNLFPGHYHLALSSGRTIWTRELTAQDLLWFSAFPAAPLRLAAASDDEELVPTIEDSVMDGSLTVQVCPGLHSGTISIRIAK